MASKTKTVGAIHRATYKYNGTESNTINLEPGRVYCIIETTTSDWWLAANEKGQVGYVPGSYLPEHLGRNATFTKRFLEKAIAVLFHEMTNRPTAENRALMTKLQLLRESVDSWELNSDMSDTDAQTVESQLSQKPKRSQTLPTKKNKAPPPPMRTESSQSSASSKISVIRQTVGPTGLPAKKDKAPAPPVTSGGSIISDGETSNVTQSEASSIEEATDNSTDKEEVRDVRQQSYVSIQSQPDVSAALDSLNLPENFGTGLVRLVKSESGLSSEKSRKLLRSVLCHLGEEVPELDRLMDKIMTEFLADVKFARDQDDERELVEIFEQLEHLKDDMQQITNPIQDDFDNIKNLCSHCVKKLQNTHPDTILAVIESDNFSPLMTLVNYYSIEPRWEIRMSVIGILHCLLGISENIARQLTPTVLPVELARDIRDHVQKPKSQEFILVLFDAFSLLLSAVEPLTVHTLEHLTEDWAYSVLLFIENNTVNKLEKTNFSLLKLFLAFNLHFSLPEHNPVLVALSKNSSWTNFSELLMLVMNRGHDPLLNSEYEEITSFQRSIEKHSVLKIMADIFSSKQTADLFYTTDLNILIEIILRNLLDLTPDDTKRIDFLFILKAMIKNSCWQENKHKATQIKSTLNIFANEETVDSNSVSSKSQKISKLILEEFEAVFN